MSMIKYVPPNSQDLDAPVLQLVKASSRGLRGYDRQQFIKRASVDFLPTLESSPPKAGEIPMHVIALGATEKYGCNRNADSFGIETCRRDHRTFVDHGRYYRHHINTDPKKSYGIIKDSAFNEPMARIELLVYLNGTKEAATRNGGLVADEEQEKLEKNADFGVSMSTRVPYDVCSGCGNKAKTRAQYCGPEVCVKYGGCRDNLGRTFEDGHTLHVDNPINDWFDISGVIRPADRIAYSMGRLDKSASDHIMGGAELAEKMGVSNTTWLTRKYASSDPETASQFRILQKLADAEQQIAYNGDNVLDLAFVNINKRVDVPNINGRLIKLSEVLTALSDNYCVLPPELFLAIVGQNSTHQKTASTAISHVLPGIFNRLSESADVEQLLLNNPYLDHVTPSLDTQFWVIKNSADWTIDWPQVKNRIYTNSLKGSCIKPKAFVKIADSGITEELATEYALYQIGFLARHADRPDVADLAELVVRGNRF